MAVQTETSPHVVDSSSDSHDWGYDILPQAESVERGNAALVALDRNLAAVPNGEESRHPLDIVVGPPEAQDLYDLDLEMNPLKRHLHWVTDPDSEYMRKRNAEALQREGERISSRIAELRARETAFRERYGDPLADAAIAYQRGRREQMGRVTYKDQYVGYDVPRSDLSSAIAEGIELQPAAERATWVEEILVFVDRR
ncbi:MAG: hypothetical protein HZC02_00140 [Candidatus Levybacteria bacterium]|nr:hypothetical protein [Candidatus Levybacteria bacterium]